MGIEDTLAANAEARAGAALATEGAALAAAQRRLAWRGAWAGAAGAVLVQAALLGALGWGLETGASGLGLAVLGLFLAVAAAESIGTLPRAGTTLAIAAASARRLFEAADTPAPVAEPVTPAELPAGYALRLEHIRFAWTPDRPPVFEDWPWKCRRAPGWPCSVPPAPASRASPRCC
ncbi:hypothetical protein ACFQU2_03065 [Siccirubricoccus deserti]